MEKTVFDFLNHLTLGTKQSYRNMAVFPLIRDREITNVSQMMNQ